jgi:hypothetical protein
VPDGQRAGSRRLTSSGNGEYQFPVRSPASTCPAGICW